MKIKSFVFNPFYENTYLLIGDENECIIIDPGCYEKYERDEIIGFIEGEGLKVKFILNTHCHIDHVLGNYYLKDHFGCELWIPENEVANYEAVSAYSPQWGIQQYTKGETDRLIKEGETIEISGVKMQVLEAPGHSPGHQVFYCKEHNILIGGDVLFKQSIGRTDLPGGDHQLLLQNIREKLYTLPDETTVFPGHGPETTIGFEKINNPFVKA
ncbi:MAG: MBL fold metallo-hydrolase [Cyclobacteriaceae bacterium]